MCLIGISTAKRESRANKLKKWKVKDKKRKGGRERKDREISVALLPK